MNELATNQDFEFAALSEANNYRAALIDEFSQFLLGRILEIGAGVGQITALLDEDPDVVEVLAVEPEKRFIDAFATHSRKVTLLQGTAEGVQSRQWNAI